MQSRHRWFVFGFLGLILCILLFFGEIVLTTTVSLIDHALGVKNDVVTSLPNRHIDSAVKWVKFVPEHLEAGPTGRDVDFVVGKPHVDLINNEWATITFQLSSSVPTKSYPFLKTLLQDHVGSTVRIVSYSPNEYHHGDELTTEPITLTIHVHPGEQRVAIQARRQ